MMSKDKRKEYNKRWREKNKEKCKELYKNWIKRKIKENPNFYKDRYKQRLQKNPTLTKEEYYKYGKKWREKNKYKWRELQRKTQKKYRKDNQEKIIAHRVANKIKIPLGTICEICKTRIAVEKHHKDYSKPLKINFVCIPCHRKLDKERRTS